MKNVLFTLLMLGSLTACQNEEQTVIPSPAVSSARLGIEPANPPILTGPDVMLNYVNGWPPKSPHYFVAAFHAFPTPYTVSVKFPLNVYVDNLYQGTILRPSTTSSLNKEFIYGELTPSGRSMHSSQYVVKNLSVTPIDPIYNIRVFKVLIEDSTGKRWQPNWVWGASPNYGYALNVHPTSGWQELP